jgi:hypothetical protein
MRFFYHYNKPASQRSGKVQVSVHVGDKCHIVDNVVCEVATKGRIRKTQPRFVMAGTCVSWEIVDGVMFLRATAND